MCCWLDRMSSQLFILVANCLCWRLVRPDVLNLLEFLFSDAITVCSSHISLLLHDWIWRMLRIYEVFFIFRTVSSFCMWTLDTRYRSLVSLGVWLHLLCTILGRGFQLLMHIGQFVTSKCREVHFLSRPWKLLDRKVLLVSVSWIDNVMAILEGSVLRWRICLIYCSLSPMMVSAGRYYWTVHAPTVALHLLVKRNATSKMAWTDSRLSLVMRDMMLSISSLLSGWFTLTLLLLLFLIPSRLLTERPHCWWRCWCLQLRVRLICLNISCGEGEWCRRHGWVVRLVQSCT